MAKPSVDDLIRSKIYRLEELRKYQAYYGPNTPYPVIVEINDLELELRRLLNAGPTRANKSAKKSTHKKTSGKKKGGSALHPFGKMSPATFDAITTIAFVAFVFLLGVIIFVTYVNTRGSISNAGYFDSVISAPPTLRPTFTPTSENSVAAIPAAQVVAVENANLPPAVREPTEVATPVPSLTPTASPVPTNTPLPTNTPIPTSPPPPQPTALPPPPTATLEPSFPFAMVEQGNRTFQRTTYHIITVYIAVVSEGNIPMGGYKVVADHSSGTHLESGLSDWSWSAANCLDCGYIKQGNLKIDLGPFTEGVWSLYLADPGGAPLSAAVPLTYSADPAQWVWDFIIFKQKS